MRLPGKGAAYFHICHMCQGKAAKRLHRQVVKSQKAKEKRSWQREIERGIISPKQAQDWLDS